MEGWLLWGPRDGVSAHSPLPSGYQSPLAGFPAVLPSSSTRKGSWDQVEEDLGTQTHQVPAPQDTLLQSWWLQRRDPAIRSEEGCLGITVVPSLWQMVPGHSLCTHSSLSSGPLAVPEHGDRELVLL